MWIMYVSIVDPLVRRQLASLEGAAGATLMIGPFVVLAFAAIRRRIGVAAWGLLCVGLAVVMVLFLLSRSVGDGGSVTQGGINAALYIIVLTLWQYVAAIISVCIGIAFDLVSWWRSRRGKP